MRIAIQIPSGDTFHTDSFEGDDFDLFMDSISRVNFLTVHIGGVNTAFNLRSVLLIEELPE